MELLTIPFIVSMASPAFYVVEGDLILNSQYANRGLQRELAIVVPSEVLA